MASLVTYTTDTALETIDEDLTYALSILQPLAFAAAYAAEYQAMIARCDAVMLQQRTLRRAIVTRQGGVAGIDSRLDGFVDKVDLAVTAITERDPSHPVRQLLFRGVRPSDLKRPVLGAELEALRPWPKELTDTTFPPLVALAPEGAALIDEADDNVVALSAAQDANRVFRLVGERKVFINDVNALRARTQGFLGEYRHTHPTEHLPSDLANLPFRSSRKSTKKTIEDLDKEIASLKGDIAALESKRAELVAAQVAETKRRTEGDARTTEAEIADAQKIADEALKRIAALKEKLGK
jgi:chorismate mutase